MPVDVVLTLATLMIGAEAFPIIGAHEARELEEAQRLVFFYRPTFFPSEFAAHARNCDVAR